MRWWLFAFIGIAVAVIASGIATLSNYVGFVASMVAGAVGIAVAAWLLLRP